jgi:hypothetical protein
VDRRQKAEGRRQKTEGQKVRNQKAAGLWAGGVVYEKTGCARGCTMSQITWDDSYSVGNDAIDA